MVEKGSIPLIRLGGNLLVSIQFELSDAVVERLVDDVTRTIEETPVSGLIVDLSGTDFLDSHVTRRLCDLAATARTMGVATVICGMRRVIVLTLVEMGLDALGVTTAINLERALELLAQRRSQPALARSA